MKPQMIQDRLQVHMRELRRVRLVQLAHERVMDLGHVGSHLEAQFLECVDGPVRLKVVCVSAGPERRGKGVRERRTLLGQTELNTLNSLTTPHASFTCTGNTHREEDRPARPILPITSSWRCKAARRSEWLMRCSTIVETCLLISLDSTSYAAISDRWP